MGRKPLVGTLSSVLCASLALAGALPGAETLPQAKPAWSLEFTSPVQWQRVTALGSLVVATATGLHGVDPHSGKVRWTQQRLAGVSGSGYEEIPGTPLVLLTGSGPDPGVWILDPIKGRIIFDSRDAGIVNVLSRQILYDSGKLLVMGFEEGKLATRLMMYDITTGDHLWTNDNIYGESGKLTQALASLFQATSKESGISAEPYEVDGNSFLLASNTGVYKIDTGSGKFLWRQGGGGSNVGFYMHPERKDLFFAGMEEQTSSEAGPGQSYTYWSAYRVEDGSSAWPKAVRLKGGVNAPIFTERGLIVSPRTEGKGVIKLLDYATGKSLWGPKGKGIKIQGGVVDHDMSPAGLVLTTGFDNAWTNKGVEFFINLLDTDSGELGFARPIKVRGRILRTEVVPRGVLYVTTSEANVIDLETGTLTHKTGITSDGSLITADDGNILYGFSRQAGALFTLDKTTGKVRQLSSQKIKLGENEHPTSLEVGAETITMTSSQNVAVFRRDGKLELHSHYPAPRRPALLRALLIASSVRAAMASVGAGVNSGAFAAAAAEQEPGSLSRTISQEIAEGYKHMERGYAGLSESYWKAARERFKASATSRDYVFMMVQLDKKSHGLARVNKATGKIDEIVDLGKEKDPVYQVDDVAGQIYYRSAPNEIVGYRF